MASPTRVLKLKNQESVKQTSRVQYCKSSGKSNAGGDRSTCCCLSFTHTGPGRLVSPAQLPPSFDDAFPPKNDRRVDDDTLHEFLVLQLSLCK